MFAFSFFLFFTFYSWASSEVITDFSSSVIINKTGTTDICETITVVKPEGTRGLIWEFPLHYDNHTVDFTLERITKNGENEPYRIEKSNRTIRIYIGRSHHYLKAGVYRYAIRYRLGNHLSYAGDRVQDTENLVAHKDILYINLPGPGWRLPIEQATASFRFPSEVHPHDVLFIAYTGAAGLREKNYYGVWNDTDLIIKTTKPLLPGQAFTIAVAWPEDIVDYPSWGQRTMRSLHDTIFLIIALLFYCIALIIIVVFMIRFFRMRYRGVPIIPLFYPPKDLSPALMDFIIHRGTASARGLAGEIVSLAIAGLLTIEYKKGSLFHRDYYVLHSTDKKNDDSLSLTAKRDLLFSGKDTLSLNNASDSVHLALLNTFLKNEQSHVQYRYINSGRPWRTIVNILLLGGVISAIIHELSFGAIITGIGGFFVYNFIIERFFTCYTDAGLTLKNQIEGFKLFLTTTEENRFKIVGSPPTKSPELYEKYLPFALVLGVEKEWAKQFVPLMTPSVGHSASSYHPIWYSGHTPFVFSPHFISNFPSILGTQLSQTNMSYTSPSSWTPRSTGFGRGGSSGGGVGGSGGGSW